MNPDEFSWKEDQTVTVSNPTAKTYKFKVHNKDYQLEAGKTARMPGYIAWVYVYGLATQIAQEEDKFNRWNEEGFRQEYYAQLVAGTDDIIQAVAPVEEPEVELLEDEVEELPVEEPQTPAPSVSKPAVAPVVPKVRAKAIPQAKALQSDRSA